ncbi:hypothetical protein TU52_18355 [Bacillus cereus]|nr:hypothetical protein TU52_18355 [Bacillus cereus]
MQSKEGIITLSLMTGLICGEDDEKKNRLLLIHHLNIDRGYTIFSAIKLTRIREYFGSIGKFLNLKNCIRNCRIILNC